MLYTEMVTTGAIRHGSVERHLRFNAEEHPVALQLGGSDAADLAFSAARVRMKTGRARASYKVSVLPLPVPPSERRDHDAAAVPAPLPDCPPSPRLGRENGGAASPALPP